MVRSNDPAIMYACGRWRASFIHLTGEQELSAPRLPSPSTTADSSRMAMIFISPSTVVVTEDVCLIIR
jgi:hypothetical protein